MAPTDIGTEGVDMEELGLPGHMGHICVTGTKSQAIWYFYLNVTHFSAAKAALEVQKPVCPSICPSVCP